MMAYRSTQSPREHDRRPRWRGLELALCGFLWPILFPLITFVLARLSERPFYLWSSVAVGATIGLIWFLLGFAARSR